MERLLNKGLNFSILPKKMDLTQVYVDFKKFKRSAIWKEFWFGKDNEDLMRENNKNLYAKISKNKLHFLETNTMLGGN